MNNPMSNLAWFLTGVLVGALPLVIISSKLVDLCL